MIENIWVVLIVVAICSYQAIKVWTNARRAEREAYYRSETLKKFAEMQGTIPESVLQILREAVKQKDPVPFSFNYDYNREREAYYKSETVKKIAEMEGGALAALQYLREDEKKAAQRQRQAFMWGGIITVAGSIGLTIFLRAIEKNEPVYLIALMPALVGVGLVVYALTSAPGIDALGKGQN